MLFLSVYLAVSPLAPLAQAADLAEPVSALNEAILQPSLPSPAPSPPSSQPIAEPEAQNFTPLSPVVDVAHLADGNKAYRIYDTPRLTYADADGGLRLRPEGWNLFNEQVQSQLHDNGELGYGYSYPAGKNGELLLITAGDMTFASGKPSLPHRTPRFSQDTEDHQTITHYQNIYPDTDVRFQDFKWWRSREILINKAPENLDRNDTVSFWENYSFPAGVVVMNGKGKKIAGKQSMTNEPLFIKLLTGERFVITPAVVFDSGFTASGESMAMYRDATAKSVNQTVVVDEKARTLSIGLNIPAAYLLDAKRTYPVIIDPTHYACSDNNTNTLSCSLTDFYVRAANGGTQSDGSAWVNGDLFAGKWLSSGVYYTRHPVMLFNTNFQQLLSSEIVTQANLYMYYRNVGNGSATSSGLTAKRITRYNPPSWPPATVSNIQNDLNYGFFRNNLVAENSSNSISTSPIGEWKNFSVTTTVQNWKQNNANNLGVLLEPTDSWSSGSTPPGSWANRLFVFDSSRNSSNTTSPYLYITTTNPQPDLTHNGSTINNGLTVAPGDTISGTIRIINQGTGSAPSGSVHVYFEQDYNYSSRLASINYSSLGVNGTATLPFSFQIPANTATGVYHVYYLIDATGTANEINENNNVLTLRNTTLTASNLTNNGSTINGSTFYPGNTISGNINIINNGNATATGGNVCIYFEKDDHSFSDSYRVQTPGYSSIAENATASVPYSFQVPYNALAGNYFVQWFIDCNSTSSESLENDNKFYFTNTRTIQAGADLYADYVKVRNGFVTPGVTTVDVSPGESITFEVNVRNSSSASASSGPGTLTYYFNQGSVSYTQGEFNADTYPSMGAGGGSVEQTSRSMPSGAGTYYFSYSIDSASETTETNEGNNKNYIRIDVVNPQTPQPDLRVSNVNLQNGSTHPTGDTLQLSARLQNTGSAGVSSAQYTIHLKSGSTVYPLTFLSPSTLNLSSGYDNTVTFQGVIPAGTPAGTYDLEVALDPNQLANDSNYGNNTVTLGSAVTIAATSIDLSVSTVVIQDNGRHTPGSSLAVSAQLRNPSAATASGVEYRLGLRDVQSGSITFLESVSPSTVTLNANTNTTYTLSGTIPNSIPLYRSYAIDVVLDPSQNVNDPARANNTAGSSNSIYTEPGSYGNPGSGGTGPGGSQPCTVRGLQDTDCDGVPDNQEKTVGTPSTPTPQSITVHQNQNNRVGSSNDLTMGSHGGDPVNLRTGALEFTQTDFELPGRGVPIRFERTYNSTITDLNNRLGYGWSTSYNTYYYRDPATLNIVVNFGNRMSMLFTTTDGGATYTAPDGVFDTLKINGNTYIYRTLDGTEYRFSASDNGSVVDPTLGILQQIADTNGNVTQLSYTLTNGIPLLTAITDASGRVVNLTYGDPNKPQEWDKMMRLEEAVNPDAASRRRTEYTYDANGDLVLVRSNRAYLGTVEWIERRFTYDANHRMLTYTDPRGTVLTNYYNGSGQVNRQHEFNPRIDSVLPGRRVYEFDYAAAWPAGVSSASHCTLVTNYRTSNVLYTNETCFNNKELLSYRADGAGNLTRFEYHPEYGLVTRVTDPNGNATTYTYDSRRRKETETLPDANGYRTVTTYAYENTFNRMTSQTETATGPTVVSRTTQYTIDPANGNVTAMTDPLNHAESFAYTPQGNVQSHTDKNGGLMTYAYTPDGNYRESESITVLQADGTSQTIAKRYGYDAYGHLTSYTDPRNFTTVNEYDTRGNLRKTRDALNQEMTYTYDPEDHRTSMTDTENHVTEWVYDTDINASLLSETKVHPMDPAQNLVTRYEYDFTGNRTKVIDPLNRQTLLVYNTANRLEEKTTPVDRIRYTYDANGNLIRETNSLNQKTEYDYDNRNHATVTRQFKDATTFVRTENVYDGFMRVVRKIDGRNNTTAYVYDLMDRVLSMTDRAGNPTTYTYDANGNRTSETLPRAQTDAGLKNSRGVSMAYDYDRVNRLTAVIHANDTQTLRFYDAADNLLRTIDRRSGDGSNGDHTALFVYDELGRKTTETDAYGQNARYTYTPMGNVNTKTDRNNSTTTFVYDPFYRLRSVQDAAGNLTTFTYDKAGNKKTVTYPDATRSSTTYDYDDADRLIKIIDATVTDGVTGVQEYTYDAVGNKKTEKDKNAHVTRYDYDLLNRLTTETNAQNTVTTYAYDENSNRLSETTSGKIRLWTYDIMDRVLNLSDRGKMTESYTYDADGNVQTRIDGNNQTITYTYDKLNRVTHKDLPGAAQDVDYAYDNWDNVTTITEAVVTFEGVYDRENRLTNERRRIPGLNGGTTALDLVRSYKPGGELESLTDASGKRVAYNYDNRNLLDTITYNNTTLADYTHNAMGNPTNLAYGNGTQTSYAYDTLNRVSTMEVKNAANTSLLKQEYQYDHESNRTRLTEDGSRTIDYAYDVLDQLTDVDYSNLSGTGTDVHYTYDAWGNRTGLTNLVDAVSYSYPANSNELQSLSHNGGKLNVVLTYDGNGSLTSEQYNRLGTNVRRTDYRYDVQGRLTGISYLHQGAPSFMPAAAGSELSFIYSDDGNRVGKRVNGVWSYSINNGLNVLDEVNAQGAVTKTMVRGLEAIAEIDAAGTLQFIHVDPLGSAVMMTDAAGTVTKKYEYEAFGQMVGADGGAKTKYQFTGQEFDAESELTYMNARYYNAALGRFLSRDPVLGWTGDLIGRNGYVYVKNNPLKYTDPTGTFELFKNIKKTWDNIEWGTVWEGTKQTAFGALNTTFGALEVVGGVTIATGGTATGIAAVPGIAAGSFVTTLGANNIVAGSTETYSGLNNIWNGLTGKKETVDYTYNPVHEGIDSITEKGSTANTALSLGYDVTDIFAGGAGIKKGVPWALSKIEYALSGSQKVVGGTGVIGEQALAKLGSSPQVYESTSMGARFIDGIIQGIAHESKVGYQSGAKILKQIAKDIEIMQKGKYSGYVWDFFTSPTTGRIGGSEAVMAMLKTAEKYGITTKFHDYSGILNTAIGGGVLSKINSFFNPSGDNK